MIPVNFAYPDGSLIDPRDGLTSWWKTIDGVHHEIHEGNHWCVEGWTDVATGADYEILFSVPATGKRAHIVYEFSFEGEYTITLYRGTTTSDDGTSIPIYNNDDESRRLPDLTIYHTPTITSDGTQIRASKGGSSKNFGGSIRGDMEIKLARGVKYLFRMTNNVAGSDQWVSWRFCFYEL